MPICPSCAKTFSGFSFGANPATECPDCRKAKAQAQAAAVGVSSTTAPSRARPGIRYLAPPPVTLAIMAANILVYVAMGISGASWTDPSIVDAVKWGADFGPLTLSSEWWRLFTSTFVHFGIIHIALNMWCLWNLGTTLEPFIGRKVFGVMYVASGLVASLVSVAWNPWRVSAGASGAIFGVAGALVSYLALKKTPMDSALVKRNLRSLGIFIFYNLLYGVSGRVDNSAHIGGLVAGLILGAAIPPMVRPSAVPQYIPVGPPDLGREANESRANRVAFTVAAVSAVVLIFGFAAVHQYYIIGARYGAAVKLVRAGKTDQAISRLQDFVKLDPESYLSQEMLGELLLLRGDPAAAIAPLEQASQTDTDTYDLQHDRALAYLGAGRTNDALQLINESLSAQKSDTWRSLYLRGIAEAETGRYAPAKADLQNVISARPDLAEAKAALVQLSDAQASGASLHLPIPYAQIIMQSEAWPLYP